MSEAQAIAPPARLTHRQRSAARQEARELTAILSLADFIRFMWPVVEPGTVLVWNWHIEALAGELESVASGATRNLLIMIPPGCMKSLIVSVMFPAWTWLSDPSQRSMYLSNSDTLVKRDSMRTRDLIRSPQYRRLLDRVVSMGRAKWTKQGRAPRWAIKRDQDEKFLFANDAGGFRQAQTIGAKVTGKRSDIQVVDDPYDAEEASEGGAEAIGERMARIVRKFKGTLRTRLNDPRTSRRIVIMQRLHMDDLAGVLAEDPGWRVVCIPMEYNPDHPHRYDKDPRTVEGELLDAVRFDQGEVDSLRADLGPLQAAAQLDQYPRVAGGGSIKARWFKAYDGDPRAVARHLRTIWISVDAGRKKRSSSRAARKKQSYNVIQVWGFKGPLCHLLDQRRGRWDYNELEDEFEAVCKKWPRAQVKMIEDHANGTVLIQRQRPKQRGIIAFEPASVPGRDKSKAARAKYTEIAAEAGQILLPSPSFCPWIEDWIEEHASFGAGGSHDDQVDCTSQVMVRRSSAASVDPRERLRRGFQYLK